MDQKYYPLWKPVTDDESFFPRSHDVGGRFKTMAAVEKELVQKAVADSGTTSPIVPQELSPDVIPVFVRHFPLFDMIRKVPSNGLSHTWQRQTAFSQNTEVSTLIAETGSVNDDTNTYQRQTSNIAVFSERRGVTLKAEYAGQNAGGPGSDLSGREESGGLMTIARDAQNVMLRYQEVDSSSTTTTAKNGKYSALGFNGLRYVIANQSPSAQTVKVDITSAWTDQRVLTGVRDVANSIWDGGGNPDLIVTNTTGAQALFADQMALMRYINGQPAGTVEITPGRTVGQVSTDVGLLPVLIVPGNSIGTYTDTHTYNDIFVLDTSTLLMPYLGNPLPSVLRIPIGTDGTLRSLVIPFAMYGLACMAPEYLGRVSLETAA